MDQRKVKAFVEIPSDQKLWDLSDRYQKAIEKYIQSIPTTFYVVWPPEAIPPVGSTIMLYDMPGRLGENLTVMKLEYGYCREDDLEVYIRTDLVPDFRIDVYDLTFLAEAGCLFDSKLPIENALAASGLPSRIDELPKPVDPHTAFRRFERMLKGI